MNSGSERKKPLGILVMAGFALLAMAFLAPDATHRYNGAFFKLAMSTTWRNPLDLAAAWCSLKIICLSVGLFLFCESAGTMFARQSRRGLAVTVYILEIFPVAGCLVGGYFLVKSLL